MKTSYYIVFPMHNIVRFRYITGDSLSRDGRCSLSPDRSLRRDGRCSLSPDRSQAVVHHAQRSHAHPRRVQHDVTR